jgi:hypothetical protein
MTEKTLVALYTDLGRARRAVTDLQEAGFAPARVSLVGAKAAGRVDEPGSFVGEGAGAGATLGALLGGGAGLLAGLGVLALPGLGTVLAAGPLMALLAGAGVGVTAGGLAGGLIGLGIPRAEAEAYARSVQRGGAVVVLDLPADDEERATAILERHDPEQVEEPRVRHYAVAPELDLSKEA